MNEFRRAFAGHCEQNRDFRAMHSLTETAEFRRVVEEKLEKCILHHRMLLRISKQMEEFFWPISGVKILLGMFFIIFSVFMIVKVWFCYYYYLATDLCTFVAVFLQFVDSQCRAYIVYVRSLFWNFLHNYFWRIALD